LIIGAPFYNHFPHWIEHMQTIHFKPDQRQLALNLVLGISALVAQSLLSPAMAQPVPAPTLSIQRSADRATFYYSVAPTTQPKVYQLQLATDAAFTQNVKIYSVPLKSPYGFPYPCTTFFATIAFAHTVQHSPGINSIENSPWSNVVRSDCPTPAASPAASPAVAEPAPAAGQNGAWTALPGAALDIGAGGASNAMWVVGTDRVLANGANVYRWGNNTWQTMPSTGAVRLDVDTQGNAWIVNNKGEVQHFDGTKWLAVPGVAASDVGVGANGTVWAIGNVVNGSGNYAIYRLSGTTWSQMAGDAVRIDVDPAGNAWVANKGGDVFRWTGSTWVAVPGVKASDVGVGQDGSVFVTATDAKVYRWSGNAWVTRTGEATNVSVSATGVPFVVNAAGTIYQGVK
jgi:hypothetical protein